MKIGIIGNNIAGIMTAKKIRDLDKTAEITVFSKEPYHYYPRPKLIEFLSGAVSKESLFVYEETWYQTQNIHVNLNIEINRIDIKEKVLYAGSEKFVYDKLIFAGGASSFLPPVQGKDLNNVLALRTLEDAEMIKESAENSKSIIIIGGGVLGLETANALHKLRPEADIVILELSPHLLSRQLDKSGAEIIESVLKENKITVITSAEIQYIAGAGQVEKVVLKNRTLAADLIIFSAGVRPRINLAQSAGLKTNRGILVNDYLETSVSDIYAVGDCAEYQGTVYGLIKPILEMAPAAAANVLNGNHEEFHGFTMSKTVQMLGLFVTSIGEINPEDENSFEIIRVKGDRQYKKYVIQDNILKGYIAIGSKVKEKQIQQMIHDHYNISAVRANLSDIDFLLA